MLVCVVLDEVEVGWVCILCCLLVLVKLVFDLYFVDFEVSVGVVLDVGVSGFIIFNIILFWGGFFYFNCE